MIVETALSMTLTTLATFLAASVALCLTPGADMMFNCACGAAAGLISCALRRAGRVPNRIRALISCGLAARPATN